MNLLEHRVAEALKTSDIDVAEVARACGISVQAVYKWMSGASKTIAGEHLIELSRLTNFEPRWIISGMGEKRKDPKIAAVAENMTSMPEYKKDLMVQMSITLAEN